MKQQMMNSTILTNETGRSMVEMLGVLAIVGVLSVGGVYGYGVAMKKHKANELLHRASILASTVSAQILTGKNPTALDNFANSDFGTFSLEPYTEGDNTFKLKISDIDADVCKQMKSSMGGMVRDMVCDENAKTALMTFNNDLSTKDLPKTESVIDKNITNPEDCQNAGKTWCTGLNGGEGACSNVKDCCQSVSVDNVCQSCSSVTGEIINRVQASSCDSDGDGSNDGICFPVEQSGESCSGTNLDELCLNGVQFQLSENMMCVPVSCKALESMNLSQCCQEYDLGTLEQATIDAFEAGNMPQAYSYMEQLHIAQCTACDSDTGNITQLPDGTECVFYDDLIYNNYAWYNKLFASYSVCQNGKCVRPSGFIGWKDEELGRYSCDEPEDIEIIEGYFRCTGACPNRILAGHDHDGQQLCVLDCPENTYELADNDPHKPDQMSCALCHDFSAYIPKSEAECLACGMRKMENGKCVLDSCPVGYFEGDRFCIPCDLNEKEGYVFAHSEMQIRSTQEKCQKCADDGAHERWMDGDYCRY